MNDKVVESFRVKKKLFGGYKVAYKCPHCDAELSSQESEITDEEQCPECGMSFYISDDAAQRIQFLRDKGKKQEAIPNREDNTHNGLPPRDSFPSSESKIDIEMIGTYLSFAIMGGLVLVTISSLFYFGIDLKSYPRSTPNSSSREKSFNANEDFVRRKFESNGLEFNDEEIRKITRTIEKASKESDR